MASTLVIDYLFLCGAACFQNWAKEFGEFRIWAGMHCWNDIEAGYEIGRQVGADVSVHDVTAPNDGVVASTTKRFAYLLTADF